jgi:iron complex outermembrane receptor protein
MKIKLLLTLSLFPIICFSQQQNPKTDSTSTTRTFSLGEVTIVAVKNEDTLNSVKSETMDALDRFEVSKALNILPGISLTNVGPRNESGVSVRGFDLRQVPIYLDGIPVYVPYDGYVDLARFTTFDLASIDVSKGFSSMLFGPNSLGGAINLVSRKPVKKFEFDGAVGMLSMDGYKGNVNVGSNLGKFYFQGGYSYLHSDGFMMSAKYDSTKNENGKLRDNSYRTDQKISFKIGFRPTEKQEYVVGYINQQGEKGTPVYCGNDPLNSMLIKPRFWQWPVWNKESYYFISNNKLNEKNYIKTRFYYDIFKNNLFSYDNNSYTTQFKPWAFQSFYNDYTYGGSVEYGTTMLPKNNLKLAIHYKEDVHRENNLNEPVRHFEDNTVSIGIEDVFKINEKLSVIPGASFDARTNVKAEDYSSTTHTVSDFATVGTSNAYNGQLGIFYLLKENHKIGATVSHKTRFATIKDRYSYKMGTAIQNPELKPESSDNYEINYTALFCKKVTFQTALFYSHLTDVILNVSNVQPGKSQMQNFGVAEYLGVELQANYKILENLSVNANYTYMERHNISNPSVQFTDVPYTKVFGMIQYEPISIFKAIITTEYDSPRYSTSYGARVDGFTLVNAAVSAKIWKYFSLELGMNNIFDVNYSLAEGYPEEGRNFFVTLRFFNFNQ